MAEDAEWDKLTSEDSSVGKKALYLLYIIVIMGVLLYGSIGASPAIRNTIYFYVIFGAILGMIPLIFDMLTKNRGMVEEVDTISYEEPAFDFLTAKVQIVLALVAGLLFFWNITVTGQAWVGAPTFFGLFDGPILFGLFDGGIASAILSGLVGLPENIVFFGFAFPTSYAIVSKYLGGPKLAVPLSIIIASGIFLGYHSWVYGTNQMALLSVTLFGVINCIIVMITRSLIVSDTIHFVNNFSIGAKIAESVAFSFALW